MLGALYIIGIPVFVFFAWVFSEAVHVREFDDRNSRILARLIRARADRSFAMGV